MVGGKSEKSSGRNGGKSGGGGKGKRTRGRGGGGGKVVKGDRGVARGGLKGGDEWGRLEKYQKIGIVLTVVVVAGFFGWIYEFVFYFFNGGMGEFYMQGGNFLPWINIYAIGAVLILATTWRIRERPWAVFLVSVVVTGVLELVAGWLIYEMCGGTRFWDYNTEILNFGNIGGFVCLRSVLFFGVSALLLVYAVMPFCVYLAKSMSRRAFLAMTITLFAIVMMDEVYNLMASRVFDWVDAMEVYRAWGWRYAA